MSVPTELGIKPVWQGELSAAILATIFTGGQGVLIKDLNNGTIIEVISEYHPGVYPGQEPNEWPSDAEPLA